MQRLRLLRVGVLFAALPLLVLSCGERNPTEPVTLASEIDAVPVYDVFYNTSSILDVPREILIDSRVTQIEWDAAGSGNFVKMSGAYGGGGGDYYANVRAEWTRDKFGRTIAIQLVLQWPDLTEDRLDHPIVDDSVDVFNDATGAPNFNCDSTNILLNPHSWHRGNNEEDQVVVEIFSKPSLTYSPLVDNWRWGAGTTDPATPVSVTEFPGADNDSIGSTTHPSAGFMEDRYDLGAGPVDDAGPTTYEPNYTQYPDGVVPKFLASKGTRDSRLNRGKPTPYTVWKNVAQPLRQCDLNNPIRVDDASQRDKSWNRGDYVPGWVIGFPLPDNATTLNTSSSDVLARGSWLAGKWSLEIRRKLDTGYPDDLPLQPPATGEGPRTYGIRITIRDGTTQRSSQSAIIPLVLLPVRQ